MNGNLRIEVIVSNPYQLQQLVQKFLDNTPNIKIKNIVQTQSSSFNKLTVNSHHSVTMSIFYEVIK